MNAEEMLWELESNFLEVVLIPAPETKHSEHFIRAVQSQNAGWYQKFCQLYPSNRRGRKTRTRIKRRETRLALEKILKGETSGVYVERLLDFIESESSKNLTDIPF